jgi:phenylpropionate dioxygenase-like ring-hydroxylating dioxygenase large terminal subunit
MTETHVHPSSQWPAGLEKGLRGYWYPICRSEDLGDKPIGLTRLSEPLVAWRGSGGVPHVLHDRCPHRGAALSVGRVWGDLIGCRYHGLVFDGSGQCRDVPAAANGEKIAEQIKVRAYRTEEAGGAIWAFLGDGTPTPFDPPKWLIDQQMLGWWQAWTFEANWLLVQDNNGDVCHTTFAHDPTYVYGKSAVSTRLRVRDFPGGVIVGADVSGEPAGAGEPGKRKENEENTSAFEFHLPCRVELWLHPMSVAWVSEYHKDPNAPEANPRYYSDERPYRCVQYMLPIDENRTLFMNWYGRGAATDEQATHWRDLYNSRILPSELVIFGEDDMLMKSARSLQEARSFEHLFNMDVGTIRIRRLLADAYLASGATAEESSLSHAAPSLALISGEAGRRHPRGSSHR